jgi:hypothetical protein
VSESNPATPAVRTNLQPTDHRRTDRVKIRLGGKSILGLAVVSLSTHPVTTLKFEIQRHLNRDVPASGTTFKIHKRNPTAPSRKK